MKILYIITLSSWGGAQKYVYTLASSLSDIEGLEIAVAGGKESRGELADRLKAADIEFIPLKLMIRSINPVKDLLAVFKLKKLIEERKPDVVHLNSSKAGAVGSLAARLAKHKAKVIYTVHGWVFNEDLNPMVKSAYYLIEKYTAGFKDAFICLSDYERKISIAKKIAPAKKLALIRNGIDLPTDYFLPAAAARQKFGIAGDDGIIIGCIANFFPTKGLNYLIEAVKILVQDHKMPILAIIIGEGQQRSNLEKQIIDSQLQKNIILTGSIANAGTYLKAFDIAVISSVKEGVPYFLLEAMAANLPIVATRVGGIPEIIDDDKTGLLVKSMNPKDLADKIMQLANNQELRIRFGRAGMEKIKKEFSEVEMINKTLNAYHN